MDNNEKTSLILEKHNELLKILQWYSNNTDILSAEVYKDAKALTEDGLDDLQQIFFVINEKINSIYDERPPCPFVEQVREGEPLCRIGSCETCKYKMGCTIDKAIIAMLRTINDIAREIMQTIERF